MTSVYSSVHAFSEPELVEIARADRLDGQYQDDAARDEWLADVVNRDLRASEWRYRRVRYSRVVRERRAGGLPAFLGASCVAIRPSSRTILLHRRSDAVATYPGMLHTTGGAWVPGEDATIEDAMKREALEECGARISTANAGVLVGRELTTGSVQVVWLGADYERPTDARDQSEGAAVELSFDELPDALMEPDWVPSGRMHVTAWLMLVAARGTSSFEFAGLSADGLAQKVLAVDWTPPPCAMNERLDFNAT